MIVFWHSQTYARAYFLRKALIFQIMSWYLMRQKKWGRLMLISHQIWHRFKRCFRCCVVHALLVSLRGFPHCLSCLVRTPKVSSWGLSYAFHAAIHRHIHEYYICIYKYIWYNMVYIILIYVFCVLRAFISFRFLFVSFPLEISTLTLPSETLRPKLEPQIDVFCSAKSMIFRIWFLPILYVFFTMYCNISLECGDTFKDSKL